MPKWFHDRKIATLVLITLVGFVIGSYLSLLIALIPGDYVVVREVFNYNFLPISIGYPDPWSVDLGAIKFQVGFLLNINFMSIVGFFIALYSYRWYR